MQGDMGDSSGRHVPEEPKAGSLRAPAPRSPRRAHEHGTEAGFLFKSTAWVKNLPSSQVLSCKSPLSVAFPLDVEKNVCSQPGIFPAPASEWHGAGLHAHLTVWSQPSVIKRQVLATGGLFHEDYLWGRMLAFVGALSLLCASRSPAAPAGAPPSERVPWDPRACSRGHDGTHALGNEAAPTRPGGHSLVSGRVRR